MSQSQIMGADRARAETIIRSRGSCMGMVHYNMLSNAYLFTIRFLSLIRFFSPAIRLSPAIRFYKPTSGVIVNNSKYWLNLYDIWILENKGGTTLQKLRSIRAKPESGAWSAWDLRAETESRAKPEQKRGSGLGRGLGEPLPRKFLEFRTSNC